MLFALLGALVFLGLILALITFVFMYFGATPEPMPLFLVLCAVASLLGYFSLGLPLIRQFQEKWSASLHLPQSERLKRRLVVTSYSFLFAVALVVFTLYLLDLLSLGFGTPIVDLPPAAIHFFRFFLPPLVALLAASSFYKLHAATMLDRQKQSIAPLVHILNDPTVLDTNIVRLTESTPQSTETRHLGERLFLEELCKQSIVVATKVGLRTSQPKAHIIAGIFLADPVQRHFVPIATHGGSAAYQNAMRTFRPPFFDFPAFKSVYTQYADRVEHDKPRSFTRLLHEFREDTRNIVSNCGIVYTLERNFSFGPRLYNRCIAHRFDFLKHLPAQERERYEFEQSVGLPLVILDKKVGVLLLLSDSFGTFYPRDQALYNIIAQTVSLGLRTLFENGDISHWIQEVNWEQYPSLESNEAERLQVKAFVNSITDNFRWRKKK